MYGIAQKKTLDANQELLALGVVNLFGAFVGSMPVTASFGRTAVNSSSGAKTPLGGVVTGLLVLLTLAFLLPYCAFIPKATLGAVIVCAVVFSIDLKMIFTLWKSKSD